MQNPSLNKQVLFFHKLLFLICFFPFISNSQNKIIIPPPPPPPPVEDGNAIPFACNPSNINVCQLVKNPTFTISCTDPGSDINHSIPFFSCVDYWTSSHGTPQININTPQYSSGVNHASMWTDASIDVNGNTVSRGEGIAIGIPKLTINSTYSLSLLKRYRPYGTLYGPDIDDFYVVLLKCATFNALRSFPLEQDYTIPDIPSTGAQVIYHETDVSNTDWQSITQNFVANDEYDVLWIFPKSHTTTPGATLQEWLEVTQPQIKSLPYCGPITCTPPTISPAGPIDYHFMWEQGISEFNLNSNASGNIQWYINGVAVSGATNPILNFADAYVPSHSSNSSVNVQVSSGSNCLSVPITINFYPYGAPYVCNTTFTNCIPVNTPVYFCKGQSKTLRTFDLGPSATYTWKITSYSPIFLNITGQNQNMAFVDVSSNSVNVGWGNRVLAKAELNGYQKIFDFNVTKWYDKLYGYYGCPNTGIAYAYISKRDGFVSEIHTFPGLITYVDNPAYTSSIGTNLISLSPTSNTPVYVKYHYNGASSFHSSYYTNNPDDCFEIDRMIDNTNWPTCNFQPTRFFIGDVTTQKVTIYPNPANNKITLTSLNSINYVEISDFTNPVLKRIKIDGSKYAMIDISALSPGLYNCKVITSKGVENQKFIINRQ